RPGHVLHPPVHRSREIGGPGQGRDCTRRPARRRDLGHPKIIAHSASTYPQEGLDMPAPSQIIRAILASTLFALLGTQAQGFPNKPVRILVPYAAGGAVDVLARTIGQSLSKYWGQQPVIEIRLASG